MLTCHAGHPGAMAATQFFQIKKSYLVGIITLSSNNANGRDVANWEIIDADRKMVADERKATDGNQAVAAGRI